MNVRPTVHGMVNSREVCSCGAEKSTRRQWCDACWEKIPTKVAKNMVTRALALARTIETCELYIKQANSQDLQVSKEEITDEQ